MGCEGQAGLAPPVDVGQFEPKGPGQKKREDKSHNDNGAVASSAAESHRSHPFLPYVGPVGQDGNECHVTRVTVTDTHLVT